MKPRGGEAYFTAYGDTGCIAATKRLRKANSDPTVKSKCLSCPFLECIEKIEADKHSPEMASIRRDSLRPVIVALKAEGLTQKAICLRVGLSRNTIWKILKGG